MTSVCMWIDVNTRVIEWSGRDKLRQQKSGYFGDICEDVTKGKWSCGCFVKIRTITEAENKCMKCLTQPKIWAHNIEIPYIPTLPAHVT